MNRITACPLTRDAFAPYGQVLDATDWPTHYPINSGKCERYQALATAEAIGTDASVILSIFKATPYELPLSLAMVERHPYGSQAFMPLQPRPWLVIIAPDTPSGPGEPLAFLASGTQGVNFPRGLWHGVLTPLRQPQDFLVIDRAGNEPNVEEFFFSQPYEVRLPEPDGPTFDEDRTGARPRRVLTPRPLPNG